jgi:hypothetical protein
MARSQLLVAGGPYVGSRFTVLAVIRRTRRPIDGRDALRRVAPGRSYVVASKPGPAGPCAQGLAASGDLTHRYGTALCGFPVEDLTIVPELPWQDVGSASR